MLSKLLSSAFVLSLSLLAPAAGALTLEEAQVRFAELATWVWENNRDRFPHLETIETLPLPAFHSRSERDLSIQYNGPLKYWTHYERGTLDQLPSPEAIYNSMNILFINSFFVDQPKVDNYLDTILVHESVHWLSNMEAQQEGGIPMFSRCPADNEVLAYTIQGEWMEANGSPYPRPSESHIIRSSICPPPHLTNR